MERRLPVADTGFIVALLNSADKMHDAVTKVYLKQQQVLLPQTVLTEVAYLIEREAGIKILVAFLKGISASRFSLIALTEQDLIRTAEVLAEYADSKIDFVDGTVMAIAEHYQAATILTLDRRDFTIFRPRHCSYFEILP